MIERPTLEQDPRWSGKEAGVKCVAGLWFRVKGQVFLHLPPPVGRASLNWPSLDVVQPVSMSFPHSIHLLLLSGQEKVLSLMATTHFSCCTSQLYLLRKMLEIIGQVMRKA